MSDQNDPYDLGGWFRTIGIGSIGDVDYISRLADMVISIEPSPKVSSALMIHQAKGRGLRQPVNPRFVRMDQLQITYKRRHNRQTLKEFPFMVIASNTPDGFHGAAKEWCIEACGDRDWDTDWKTVGFRYYFKTKAHATLFILRFKGWSPE